MIKNILNIYEIIMKNKNILNKINDKIIEEKASKKLQEKLDNYYIVDFGLWGIKIFYCENDILDLVLRFCIEKDINNCKNHKSKHYIHILSEQKNMIEFGIKVKNIGKNKCQCQYDIWEIEIHRFNEYDQIIKGEIIPKNDLKPNIDYDFQIIFNE